MNISTTPTKQQLDELIDFQFKLFTDTVRPRLTMSELQVLAAFVIFQKSGDTDSIPGNNKLQTRIQHLGQRCQCGSILGATDKHSAMDGWTRCRNCGMS